MSIKVQNSDIWRSCGTISSEKKPKGWLNDNYYIFGKLEENIKKDRRGWNTDRHKPHTWRCIQPTIKRELKIQSFSLRSKGY